MTSHTDIDTLIGVLHPHILAHQINQGIPPPGYWLLQPSKDISDVWKLTQAFATLFSYHPGCDAAAVTVQTPQSKGSSFCISLSPSIPDRFDCNAKEWLAEFMALRKVSAGGAQNDNTFSLAEKSFILHTYRVCYLAMCQHIVSQGFGDWKAFIKDQGVINEDNMKPTKREYVDKLQSFSDLVRWFADCISSHSLGKDEDVLHFHELCMTIRDMMSNRGFLMFLRHNIYYIGTQAAQPAHTYFSPPLALSTLLALSQNPKLVLGDQWSFSFLGLSGGVPQWFSMVITKTILAEHFGNVPAIKWDHVEQAFEHFVEARYHTTGYQWDTNKKLLSSARPVSVHPEITLIEHLVENGVGETEVYIACSRGPCYASVVYAGVVNETLNTRLSMAGDNIKWYQLHMAEPWVLPEATRPDVVTKMKEHLLEDLDVRIRRWIGKMWTNSYIVAGYGDLNWEAF